MPRFFVRSSAISEGKVTIEGNDAFHISRSLRMRVGESLTVCDDQRTEYDCKLISISDTVVAEIISSHTSENEPPYSAVIYQALVKGDKFDTVVQKAVETGATKIVPVLTSRCTVRPDEKSLKGKLERWRRIAAEASKQCGRATQVEIAPCVSFTEAVNQAKSSDVSLFCYEGEGTVGIPALLKGRATPNSVSVFIGPEGGYDVSEVKTASDNGLLLCGLGKRILRTETASAFVLSCLSYEYEL